MVDESKVISTFAALSVNVALSKFGAGGILLLDRIDNVKPTGTTYSVALAPLSTKESTTDCTSILLLASITKLPDKVVEFAVNSITAGMIVIFKVLINTPCMS